MQLKLIVGLGNPGPKHSGSRHNLGWLVVDQYHRQSAHQFDDWHLEPRFKAAVSEGKSDQTKLLLVKPQTFMNLSGASLTRFANFYKLEPADLLVIYDDADLDFGQIRLALDGSSGGHRGVASIIEQIGSDFYRLKLGINSSERAETERDEFVLANFSATERQQLAVGGSDFYLQAFSLIDNFIAGKLPPRTTIKWLEPPNSR